MVRGGVRGVDVESITHVFIDLDDTLYRSDQTHLEFRTRMEEYMVEELGFELEDARAKSMDFYYSHGTTLAGLVVWDEKETNSLLQANGFPVDWHHYHHFTHATIDFGKYIGPDPKLREMLMSIKKPKYIFTNANKDHAERCLKLMNLSDLFKEIVCFDSIQERAKLKDVTDGSSVVCKPDPIAFSLALDQVGAHVSSSLFLDDSLRNVRAAQEMGIQSVLVGQADNPDGIENSILTLHELPDLMPKLFAQKDTEISVKAG